MEDPSDKNNRPADDASVGLNHSQGTHPESKTHRSKNVSAVRTFASDSAAKDQYTDEKRWINEDHTESSQKTIAHPLYETYLGIASIFFIICGILIAGFLSWQQFQAPNLGASDEPERLIYAEQQANISYNPETRSFISQLMSLQQMAAPGEGDILAVSIAENSQQVTSQRFLRLLAPRIPLEASLYLDDNFMYGMHQTEGDVNPFVIFEVTNYEELYASLLRSEAAFARVISRAFDEINLNESQVGTNLDAVAEFSDILVQNQDVRRADLADNQELLYSFPNRSTLVITTNRETLTTVFDRLN